MRGMRVGVLYAAVALLAGCASDSQASTHTVFPVKTTVPPATTTRPADPGTTTTQVVTADQGYRPGDCVMFDQAGGAEVAPSIVSCTSPHVFEVTGLVALEDTYAFGTPYPGDDVITPVEDRLCEQQATKYYGRQLDPNGPLARYYLRPTPEGWVDNDRNLWCGISSSKHTAPDVVELLTVPVRSIPFSSAAGG